MVYLQHFWKPAPMAVVVGLGVASLLLSCLLQPETKGKELPSLNDHGVVAMTHASGLTVTPDVQIQK